MESLDLNYGQIFFMTLGFLPVLVCVPCWVVAKFLYEPYVKKLDEEAESEKPVPYEYQYPLGDAIDDEDPHRDFKKCIVLANTPKGLVYMRYCEDEEGFEYWANNTIAYKYLETVARKYVTTFFCSNVYIDRFTLLQKKIQGIRDKIEENKKNGKEMTEEDEVDDVFASLKSYNISNKNHTGKTEITRNDVVCEESNKYLNRGKLKEAVFEEEKEVVETPTSTMSFSSWKLWKNDKKKA